MMKISRGTRLQAIALVMGFVLLFNVTDSFISASAAHAQVVMAELAHPPVKHQPNHADPKRNSKPIIHVPNLDHGPASVAKSSLQPISRFLTPTLHPADLALDPVHGNHYLSNDGKLEIMIPAGAITSADVTLAGGSIHLHVSQLAPASGTNAGGSGLISFGTYQLQLLNGSGQGVAYGLRKAATLTLHYGKEGDFALDHAFAVFNGSVPRGVAAGRGPYHTQNAVHDARQHTLSVTWGLDTHIPRQPVQPVTKATPTPAAHIGAKMVLLPQANCPTGCYPLTSVTWDTYTYQPFYGAPNPLSVNLNAGSVTEGIKVDVPNGPAGTLPNITLAYDSAAVNAQHDPRGAASWVGEGWSMGLGEISWSEHNVQVNNSQSLYEDSWQLVDPFGTSADLIPPNTNFSTYYDDSPTGQNPTTTVQRWHTSDEAHIKVYSMPTSLNLQMSKAPPCFRVWETDGVMEEFGCTSNALQYYYVPGVGMEISAWYLDLITSPEGNQVHIGYSQDTVSTVYNGTTYTYPRDTVLSAIEWDSPTCTNASTECGTGDPTPNKWAPQYRVYFSTSHAPSHLTNSPSGCNTGTNLRCDDPVDLSGSGGIGAPEVQHTFALNDIDVQVNESGTWDTLRDYRLSYEQTGPVQFKDSATGKQESTAGYLDLTKIQEYGDDGSTAYPATTLGYSTQDESYIDSTFYPYSTGYCGSPWITWNSGAGSTGAGTGCSLWSISHAGNDRYLTTVDNGEGLNTTFTWSNARSNTHGLPTGIPATRPFSCTTASSTAQAQYPCDAADDQAWSRMCSFALPCSHIPPLT